MADVMPTLKVEDQTIGIPIYNDLAACANAWGDGRLGFGDVTAGVGLALGILNTALNPVGAVLRAPVDYLLQLIVQNIEPLDKAINDLLGDPASIEATAKKWVEAGDKIGQTSDAYVASLPQIEAWTGASADAYRQVAQGIHQVFEQARSSVASVAGWIGFAGSLVAAFRSLLWGLLVDFLTEVIQAAILALASAVPSFGASIAAFTGWFGARAAMIAGKFTKNLSKLMTKMGDLARKLGMSGRAFDTAAASLRQIASRLGRSASQGFGRAAGASGRPGLGTPQARMPGDNRPTFNDNAPDWWDSAQQNYDRATRGTDAADAGSKNAADANDPESQDLPEDYR